MTRLFSSEFKRIARDLNYSMTFQYLHAITSSNVLFFNVSHSWYHFSISFVSCWNPSLIFQWNCRCFLKTVLIKINELDFLSRATGQRLNFTEHVLNNNCVIWIFSYLHDFCKTCNPKRSYISHYFFCSCNNYFETMRFI